MTRKISVLNEYLQVEKILENGFSREEFNYNDLTLLSKKFFNDGLRKKELKNKIIGFCEEQDENFNLVLHESAIDSAIKNATKYNLRTSYGNIPVYQNELDKIKNLDFKLYKILFVCLVLSRHNKFSSVKRVQLKPKSAGAYYVNKNFLDILRYSGIKQVTKKEANVLKYKVDGELGFISASFMSENSWQVLFAEDGNKSDVAVLVTDVEKVLDFLPVFCIECGKSFNKSGKIKRDRCENCYAIYKEEKDRVLSKNRMMKMRKNVTQE